MEAKFKYAVRKAGSNYGIEDIKQLKDLVAKGKVDPSDYVFIYKTEEWKRLGELGELRAFFPAFNAGASTRSPSSDNINALPNLRQLEAANKSGSSSPNIATGSFRSKNDSSQSRLDVGSLFADVPDKPTIGKSSPAIGKSSPSIAKSSPTIAKNSASSTLLTPFVPGASASAKQGSRPALATLPRPAAAGGSRSAAPVANPFGSSNKLPRLEEGETPPAANGKSQPVAAVTERPNYLRYVLFLLLVAIASGAITFFVMRHTNDDSVAAGVPLPVRSSR